MATDPVCGMFVDERTSTLRLVRDNRTYYFCSTHCLQEFAQPEAALRRLRARLSVAWPLSVAILLVTYGVRIPDAPWVLLALASVVQWYAGYPFFVSTRDAVRSRTWNMDVLIAVGTTAAYAYSMAVVLAPGVLPPTLYFDASSFIITLILTGNYLEHFTRERAQGTLRGLGALVPSTAIVLREGREVEIPVAEVQPGDLWRVRPGGRYPTDGIVREGHSSTDESILTGESRPVEKGPGSTVIAGGTNGEGALTVAATHVGTDTMVAQIGQLVTEAETSRVPMQQLADRIASAFVPIVFGLALVASLAWLALGAGFTVAMLVFVSVAVTACPCAFGIATPAAIVVGTGRAAEEGILFKGGDSLERASQVDLVLTDKTGTLTKGRPTLTDPIPMPGVTEEELLRVAASLEAQSEHPYATAVLEAAHRLRVPSAPAVDVRSDPGRGVRGWVDGSECALLSAAASREEGLDVGPLGDATARREREGRAWSVVVQGRKALGVLGFDDEVAPGVADAVHALASDGIEVVMATGDSEPPAIKVARAVGISEVHSGMDPRAKLELIREFQSRGRIVAFVGDGINDAPALTAADLGVAIGAGTEVAREAGGVILLRPGFEGVAEALRIGRRTVRKVRGNLAWAVGYNAILLPVAMGALVPAFGLGVYSVLPITGALAMGLSSTLVVVNSLTLRWSGRNPRPPSKGSPAKA